VSVDPPEVHVRQGKHHESEHGALGEGHSTRMATSWPPASGVPHDLADKSALDHFTSSNLLDHGRSNLGDRQSPEPHVIPRKEFNIARPLAETGRVKPNTFYLRIPKPPSTIKPTPRLYWLASYSKAPLEACSAPFAVNIAPNSICLRQPHNGRATHPDWRCARIKRGQVRTASRA
jgi:hypothetical protein